MKEVSFYYKGDATVIRSLVSAAAVNWFSVLVEASAAMLLGVVVRECM